MKPGTDRHDLTIGTPPLYVLVDPPEKSTQHLGPGWLPWGNDLRVVHVISPAAKGEVRGYWLVRGWACKREPDYIGHWPEVDAEVSRVLGVPVHAGKGPQPSGSGQGELFA